MNKLNIEFDTKDMKVRLYSNNVYIDIYCLNTNKDCDIYMDDKCFYLENIWKNTNLRYDIKKTSIKESIYIDNIEASHTFKFKIKTNLNISYKNNKIVILDNNSNKIFEFNAPFIINKTGKTSYEDTSIIFNRNDYSYILKVNKLKEDDYPIVVDPTIDWNEDYV